MLVEIHADRLNDSRGFGDELNDPRSWSSYIGDEIVSC
jgi:hypothetical protein